MNDVAETIAFPQDPTLLGRRAATHARSRVRDAAKFAANVLATCLVMIPAACYRTAAFCISDECAFPGWSHLFSLLPGYAGVYLRRAFYRLVLPHCGKDVCISFGTVFSHPSIAIGDGVYIGVHCMLGDVVLEDDVLIGSHVSIINGRRQHGIDRLDIPVREQAGEYPKVTIGRDAWIGDRALVTTDIGAHAVVGAGAVVVKPVPPLAIVVGNPAKVRWYRSQHGPSEAE